MTWENFFTWEWDGRLPVLRGSGRTQPTPEECEASRWAAGAHGLVLFRGFELSGDEFVGWSEKLSGGGMVRLAPGAGATGGQAIGLHMEDAMLRAIPSAIWFYASKPADRGGATLVCDGAALASALSRSARDFLERDILYWWRVSARSEPRGLWVRDPTGVERHYRGPAVEQKNDYADITALCRPVFNSRGRRVFGNHILNTIDHDDDGGPPRLDGFHRARTQDRKPLPQQLLRELTALASSVQFRIQLETKDILWVDNTRFLHGREAFEGSRYIVVRKSYNAEQLLTRAETK